MTTTLRWNLSFHCCETVFGKSERDACLVTTEVQEQGQCGCGPYPASVGKARFEEARAAYPQGGSSLAGYLRERRK